MRDLTAAELGIFLGHRTANDPTIYNCAELVEFTRPIDVDLFERALLEACSRIEVLNTRFFEHQGTPKAAHSAGILERSRGFSRRAPFERDTDVAGQTGSETPRSAPMSLQRYVLDPFDLENGEVTRHVLLVESGKLYGWLHVAHHIALDGYGFHLVARAVASEYCALVSGRARTEAQEPAASTSLADLAADDRGYQNSPSHQEDLAYFERAPLSRFPPARLTPYEFHAGQGLTSGPARPLRQQRHVGTDAMASLHAYARRCNASWPECVLAITAQFTSQRSGLRRFACGVPVMLRIGTPKLKVPCMAMNIVQLPFTVSPGQTIEDTVQQLQLRWREQSPHHRVRYEELGDVSFGPIVNVIPFSEPLTFGEVGSRSTNLSAGPVNDLAFMIALRSDGLELTIDGHPMLFNCESLARLADEWVEFLEAILHACPAPWSSSSRPTAPPDVVERWLSSARRHATSVALERGSEHLTYDQLRVSVERAARTVARHITAPLAGCAHQVVALELPRGIEAVVLLLAAATAGACYAFLDPDQPLERRKNLMSRLRPALLVTPSPEVWSGIAVETHVVTPTELLNSYGFEEPLEVASDPTDPAYIVFTSGSTGSAKGVVVGRGALSAFVDGALAAYPMSSQDRVLQFAPLTFDASVEEIFCTLCAGGTLVMRDAAMLDSMSNFVAACTRSGITVLDLPTAFWHEWVEYMNGSASCPASLRTVIIGGEAADPVRVAAFRKYAPRVTLVNTYGPSETTVVATYAVLSDSDLATPVTIGRPLAGVQAHLVDEAGGEVIGAGEGELWLTGPQLASSYWGQRGESKAKFVPLGTPPVRAYRTGDRVRRSITGELYFLGRLDHELKLSGYRINPAEVEALINAHEAVATSVVTADKRYGHVVLVAHVQPRVARREAPSAGTRLDAVLRQYLLERLPSPMVPTHYVLHDTLPVTTSGKLDRQRLIAGETPLDAPRIVDPLFTRNPGRDLLSTWRTVLGRPDAGPDDDFFRLGGHSLQVIQLAARLNGSLPDASVSAIFRNPTPRALLKYLTSTQHDERLSHLDVPRLEFAPPTRAASGATISSVLLTGATGFLGANLVGTLLAHPISLTCVVRDVSEDAARARLLSAVSGHRCALNEEQVSRLSILPLDLTTPLTAPEARAKLGVHDVVLHCAAEVNLTRSFGSLAPANVTATRWLLEYAHAVAARFCYVSTLAVAPHEESGHRHIEERFFDAHDGLTDGYQQSKWQAEQLCEQAGRSGLDVRVVRLGRVVGSTEDPAVNPNDLVWRVARAATRCGSWPDLAFAEVWTTVDTSAQVLTRLALGKRAARSQPKGKVYHVAHQGTVQLDRVYQRLIARGFALTRCPLERWLPIVRGSADAEDLATLAFFELTSKEGRLPTHQTFDCSHLLRALPDLDLTPIDDGLLDRYVDAAIEDGFLPSPGPGVQS